MVRVLISAWPLPLRIIEQGESIYDLVLGAKTGHLLAGKLPSVIGYDSMTEPKAANYVLPKELDNLLSNDFGKWHCLNSLGEVVGNYQ